MENRNNESSTVSNRELLETAPNGVNLKHWITFREQYNNAANLVENDTPAQIDAELNSNCNLKCAFCVHSVRYIRRSLLGFDTFKQVVDQAIDLGTRSLKLNYMNEPLLLGGLEKYIEYARAAGMVNVFFSTNGILLTEKRAEKLIKSGLTKIFISIDAVNESTYKELRQSSMFQFVVSNVLKFIEKRNSLGLQYPLVRVNFLRNTVNQAEEQEFIKFWTGKADMLAIQTMNELIDNESGLFIRPEKTDYRCSFPFKQLVVTACGDILPCCTQHGVKLRLGHISTMTLSEAWNSEPMKKLRALHKFGDYRTNDICNHCINGA